MAQKYYNTKEAAKALGISEADIKQMLDARELHGYRDGADWKFKTEDIERIASERASGGASGDDEGDVLLSEIELGHSDPGLSGTVIGGDKMSAGAADSDIRLAASDVKLGGSDIKLAESDIKLGSSEITIGGSELGLGSSEIDLGGPKKPAAKDEVASKVSQFEALDLTLDQDLSLEDSGVGAAGPAAPAAPVAGDSGVDLSGQKLEDDDLVLGGSGTGSDITIGGDSGISLVDPADSGLSLEAPLNLSGGGDDSLELGEDDLLAFSTDAEPSGLKSEDDFQLTPMEEGSDFDESESGSQVIALDTEGEGDEAATMIGSAAGTSVAAMLEEDLSTEPGLAAAPLLVGGPGDLALAGSPDAMALAQAMALPEAPYTIWNIVSLVICSLLLILVGMMMYDLMRNMWRWEGGATSANSWLMDTIVSWFEK